MAAKPRGVISVEVLPQGPRAGPRKGIAGSRIVEIADHDLQEQLESVSRPVLAAMKAVQPDSCTVEFSLGIKSTAKVPVILSGEANAAFKVSLTWKRDLAR